MQTQQTPIGKTRILNSELEVHYLLFYIVLIGSLALPCTALAAQYALLREPLWVDGRPETALTTNHNYTWFIFTMWSGPIIGAVIAAIAEYNKNRRFPDHWKLLGCCLAGYLARIILIAPLQGIRSIFDTLVLCLFSYSLVLLHVAYIKSP